MYEIKLKIALKIYFCDKKDVTLKKNEKTKTYYTKKIVTEKIRFIDYVAKSFLKNGLLYILEFYDNKKFYKKTYILCKIKSQLI